MTGEGRRIAGARSRLGRQGTSRAARDLHDAGCAEARRRNSAVRLASWVGLCCHTLNGVRWGEGTAAGNRAGLMIAVGCTSWHDAAACRRVRLGGGREPGEGREEGGDGSRVGVAGESRAVD